MRGGRRLCAGLVVVCTGWAGVAEAAPRPSVAFDFNGTYDRSIGDSGGAYSSGAPANAFEPADIPGATAPRSVLRNHGGNHVYVSSGSYEPDASWSASLLVSPDRVDGERPLLDVSSGGALPRLDLDEGVLTWRGTAVVVRDRTTTLQAGSWHHVVLTRTEAGDVAVYLDGERELTFVDPQGEAMYRGGLALFDDYYTAKDGPGRVARLRVWDASFGREDAENLQAQDVTPPVIGMRDPKPNGVASERPWFYEDGYGDDGTDLPALKLTVRREGGGFELDVPTFTSMFPDRAHWSVQWPQAVALSDGDWYSATLRAVDRAGNATTIERRFVVDALKPALTLDELGIETNDPTPYVSGSAGTAFGDFPTVMVRAFKVAGPPGPGSPQPMMVGVAGVPLAVSEGRYGGELQPPLPPGDYVLLVQQIDHAMHTAMIERPLRVVPGPSGPPGLPPMVTGTASADRLRAAALKRMRAARLRRLLAGRERVAFRADAAGTATIQVLAPPRRRARAAAAQRVVFTGRVTARRAGTARIAVKPTLQGRALLRRARSVRLTVRATFAPTGGKRATRTARLTVRR